jgi:hypothetical protein
LNLILQRNPLHHEKPNDAVNAGVGFCFCTLSALAQITHWLPFIIEMGNMSAKLSKGF